MRNSIFSETEEHEFQSLEDFLKLEYFSSSKDKIKEKTSGRHFLENNNLIYIQKKNPEFIEISKYDKKSELLEIIKDDSKRTLYNNLNLNKILTKNFNSIISAPSYLKLDVKDSVSITADNIGEFALPIVEYIRQTQPDYVVASDRGARLLGLAVFRLYHQLYGSLPTSDGTIRFRRFSKSNSQEETEQHLEPLVAEMLQYKENPRVLVLDDWVVSGVTRKLARNTFDRLSGKRIQVSFGVLVGNGADVSGNTKQTSGFSSSTDWRDDSTIIGVSYGDSFSFRKSIDAKPVRSQQAADYRKKMYAGIDRFANETLVNILKADYARTK